MAGEALGVPGGVVGLIQTDLAGVGLHGPGDDAGQRRLAGAGGADDAQALAGLEREGDVAQQRVLAALGADTDAFQRQQARRGRQEGAGAVLVAGGGEEVHETGPGGSGLDDAVPGADDQFDRLDGPAEQDGGGDDGAGGNLALDRQPGAGAERERLEDQAQEFDGPGIGAADELGVGLGRHGLAALAQLAGDEGLAHAQRAHDLGLGGDGLLGGIGLGGGLGGGLDAGLGRPFVQDRQHEEDRAADQGQHAERPVQHEAEQQIDRRPGDVAQRQRALAAEARAEGVEVPHGLGHLGPGFLGADDPVQDRSGEKAIETQAGADQDARANVVERRQGGEREGDHHGHEQQGQNAPRRHDAVVDLHHVEGRGEVQDVDEGREAEGEQEVPAAGLHGLREGFRSGLCREQRLKHGPVVALYQGSQYKASRAFPRLFKR